MEGISRLVISCPVPAFGLLIGPGDRIRVSLMIKTSPETVAAFRQHLGLRLQVFETTLKNDGKVYICRDAPRLSFRDSIAVQHRGVQVNSKRDKSLSRLTIKMKLDFATSHLHQHLDFPHGSPESEILSAGCVVRVVEASPSTVTLHIGDRIAKTVYFPFHVQGSQSKVRVARKSSWVEIDVPIHTAPLPDKFDSWTRSLLSREGPAVLWSIPKINLAIQPEIKFPPKADSTWVKTFLGSTLSDSERPLQYSGQATTTSPKYDLKQSLGTMYASFVRLHPQPPSGLRVFELIVEKSCHTIMFADEPRS